MQFDFLKPAPPKALKHGKLTEVSAFTPIIQGRVPGERRTYEERLRFNLSKLTDKINNGLPTELQSVHILHFGRITIIRPEQYLAFEKLKAAKNPELDKTGNKEPAGPSERDKALAEKLKEAVASEKVYQPQDDYSENGSEAPFARYQSWILTQVVFDGDIKAYFRDIAGRLNTFFDAIYSNCELYPGTQDFERFWRWILSSQLESDMFYSGNPYLSVARIRELEDFKRRFDLFVAKVRNADGSRAENMDELFDEFLFETRQRPYGFPADGGVYIEALDIDGGKA